MFDVIINGPAAVDPPRLTLVMAPAVELLQATDDVVTQALRLDPDADDTAYLTMVLTAARKHFERVTGLSLITQQWQVTFDDIPIRQGQFGLEVGLAPSMARYVGQSVGREISFARGPLQTVDLFQYIDSDGATQTFASSNYTVGNVGVATAFGRLWLNDGADWPTIGSYPGAITVKFTTGFGDTAADVPEDVRMAVLFLAAHWYENRLPVSADGLAGVPQHLNDLIEMHRVSFIA